MSRTIITLTALALLSGCDIDSMPRQRPESITKAGNGYQVERLFTYDGCIVYRFDDWGNPRYFTRCDGETSSDVSWRESCGKNCSRQVSVPTARGKEIP